jgi:undecaprenyl-diphosphatase
MQFFEVTNQALFLLINATPTSPAWLVDFAGVLAMDAIWLIPILITGMWVWGDEALRRLAVEACVTTMVGLGMSLLIRHVLPHPRPFMMGLGYAWLEHAPVPSFPSDHALVFAAVALTLLAGGRIIAGLLTALFAIAVGWARVFLGVHFPLDIVGSMIVAYAARAMVTRHGNQVAMARCLPGSRNPSSGLATAPRLDPQTSKRSLTIVAAFDFDGTITTTDSLREFVRYTVGNVRLVTGALRAAPWLIGVLLGTCDRGKAKGRFLAATLGAIPEPALREAARRYVEGRLPSLVRPEMMARIRQHQRMGHKTILVSASPSLYLEVWANRPGSIGFLQPRWRFKMAGSSATWRHLTVVAKKKCGDCANGSAQDLTHSMHTATARETANCSPSPMLPGDAALMAGRRLNPACRQPLNRTPM